MRRLPATAAAVVVLATAGAGAGTAFAAGAQAPAGATGPSSAGTKAPATLQEVQARAAKAVADRVGALDQAIARVQAATDLGADQATLLTSLRGDVAGLQAVGHTIAGDTTVAAAATDARTIVTGYRVFALAIPMSRLVLAADRIDGAAVPKLTALQAKLAARVTPADAAQVTPLLTDLSAQAAAARSATTGLAGRLLSLTPAAYNADHSLLAQPRAAVKTAVGDLKKAVADAKQARNDLRAARHPVPATTPSAGPTPPARTTPTPTAGA